MNLLINVIIAQSKSQRTIYSPYTDSGDSELCPNCNKWFSTSDIEVTDMRDGDCDYGVCPHCGALLKLYLVPSYYFDVEVCSVEEFENEEGCKLSGKEQQCTCQIDLLKKRVMK